MTRNIHGVLCTLLLAAAAGCSTPNSQLTACQQDKEQLLTAIREQRETGRSLKEQVASLETRLNQAETELARGPSGTRISSRPTEPSQSAKAVKGESLPWRSPPGKSESPPPKSSSPVPGGQSGKTSSSKFKSVSLATLASHDERLHYDRSVGTARLDTPIEFAEGGATLTAQGKRQLDDVARLLKTDEARDFRVMVTGQTETARAQAVADYLDRHGIAGERLGVSGTNSPALSSKSQDKRLAASDVQIFLLEPTATVVGWNAGGPKLRR